MTSKQIEAAKEAIAFLKQAAEAFDQAGALLKDAGLYNDGVTLPFGLMRQYDLSFEQVNEKLMPKLIDYVEDAAKEEAEPDYGGYRKGEKCPCVSGENSDGSGHEWADPDCDLCNGTGYVGMSESELIEEER